MPPRILLCTAGSLGDLHPFIAVALALRGKGLQPEIASSPQHGDKVRAEGLIFHSVGPSLTELERSMGMDEAALTQAVARSNTFLFEKMLLPYLESGARQLLSIAAGAGVIVGSTFAAGAGMAADRLSIPFVPVALQPAILFSAYDPPHLPNAPWLGPAQGGPRLALNRLTVQAARLSAGGWTKPVDEVRRRLGLEAQGANLLTDSLKGRDLALGLYSPLLGTAQRDAPENFVVTGYAAYDSDAGGAVRPTPELDAFLAAGAPPIAFTLGSAAVNIPGDFFVQSLKATRALNRRAVLLVGPGGDRSIADRPDAIALAYAPFSTLFPRCEAIVHQGGVGTTQQALRAGRPQLIVPHLGDQYDNAARVGRLACGAALSRQRYTAPRVARTLEGLLSNANLAQAAFRLSEVASDEDGASVAADRIAALIGR